MLSCQHSQNIAVILYDYALPLDISGPTDAFTGANQYRCTVQKLATDDAFYRFHYISANDLIIKTKSGLKITADILLADANPLDYDALLVPGGNGVYDACQNRTLIQWLQTAHEHVLRTMSVCSGSALLAEAGVLDGQSACTHWSRRNEFGKRYPNVKFDTDSLYVSDGKTITSAGVTSGIDMALAVIEADLGRKAALQVARHLVVHLKRPGNQSQFSGPLRAQTASRTSRLDKLIRWIFDHLTEPLPVEKLAKNAGMSPRSFARHFTAEVGETPAKFIEQARLENARLLIEEDTGLTLQEAANVSGFSSTEHLTRAFERRFGIHPTQYRASFKLI